MYNKTIFIGSSGEGLKAAEAVQILLNADGFETIVWNQGVFGLSKSILEEWYHFLIKQTLVCTNKKTARDNTIKSATVITSLVFLPVQGKAG